MALVEVHDLVKRYTPQGPNAVDGISFEIYEGEIFGLLGPNGAGKSTTIGVMSTLIAPTEGHVVVNGYDTQQSPMEVRRSIGVVPQDLALYNELTAYENLHFWGEMRNLHGEQLKREITALLGLMELTERAGDKVSTFSGGMKRRLNLAVGLLGKPKFIMLDEPTVAIDPQSRRYILDWVKELRQQGLTILYTTHYMEEAQELSDRIGIIDHGKLIALGTLEELTQLVGQHETLVLKLSQEVTAPTLTETLITHPEISSASVEGETLIANVAEAESTLPHVLSSVAEQGMSVRTIEIHEPNLETVFLHLTGRALRD